MLASEAFLVALDRVIVKIQITTGRVIFFVHNVCVALECIFIFVMLCCVNLVSRRM